MATFRGLVTTLQIRDDGWVELIIQAVHAGNATQLFFIKDLDGDITMAHKRLGQLSLLRDAITRTLPVEIDYDTDPAQGNLINEVTVHPRPSIEGRLGSTQIQGVVIGVSIAEIGPSTGMTPYLDPPDLAGITLLKDDGNIIHLSLDLQREEKLTMHAMLALLHVAHKNRRPVIVQVSQAAGRNDFTNNALSNVSSSSVGTPPEGYIEACEWVTVPEETLNYCYAFVERLAQRYESYDSTLASELSHIKVVYTTAPGQTPEGDISDNGSFVPATNTAWLHDDSPLLKFLRLALKMRLQVKLGLLDNQIHEVEMISHLGSASRPIWICVNQSIQEASCHDSSHCSNVPTIQTPSNSTLGSIPASVIWKGKGYFNEGIWRFQVISSFPYQLKIDCKNPCCSTTCEKCCNCPDIANKEFNDLSHFYLNGVHTVKLLLDGYQTSQPFQLLIYRIR